MNSAYNSIYLYRTSTLLSFIVNVSPKTIQGMVGNLYDNMYAFDFLVFTVVKC